MIQRGTFTFTAMESVTFGLPAAQTIAAQAERLDAARVFLLVSSTLRKETGEVDKMVKALGARYAGVYDSIPAHPPREAVVDAASAARAADADLLVTFGGGSVTDGGKIVQICLRHHITDIRDLDHFRSIPCEDGTTKRPEFEGPTVRQITVPTTLSGAEFNPLGGCVDHRVRIKEAYYHPLLVPRVVVLDPSPTLHTPDWLWLSTGIRALDHAVEGLCSLQANPYCDGAAIQAMRLLARSLPLTQLEPDDLEARLQCQIATWLSMTCYTGSVPMGASHAIGHVLGSLCNVPHGYTSCITLPSVLRWNAPISGERQALVAEAMGRPGVDAGEAISDFISSLGLPRTLREVGVRPDQFEAVARSVMHDRWVHTNPRKIHGPEDIVEILQMAN